jgi:glutathione S-transferase
MILRTSGPSPFGRKVVMAASILGLTDHIQIVPADTNDPTDTLRAENPLGKIPVLVLEDGGTLYDSRVILDYLDHRAGGGIIIPHGEARFPVLKMMALADGILDACILQVYEKRFRPEDRREVGWVAYQAEKVKRAMTWLEQGHLPDISARPDGGAITLAAALGYLDLRFEGQWRNDYPRLVSWLRDFAKAVPAFDLTAPPKS